MEAAKITRPAELENEDEYQEIVTGLLAEAKAMLAENSAAQAVDFIHAVGYRRWMSNYADYWNIPEDEELSRREVALIDRFLGEVFSLAKG